MYLFLLTSNANLSCSFVQNLSTKSENCELIWTSKTKLMTMKNVVCEVVKISHTFLICSKPFLYDIKEGLIGRILIGFLLFEHCSQLYVYMFLFVLTANFFFSSRFYRYFSARSIIRHIYSVLRSSLDIAALFCSTLILLDFVMCSVCWWVKMQVH